MKVHLVPVTFNWSVMNAAKRNTKIRSVQNEMETTIEEITLAEYFRETTVAEDLEEEVNVNKPTVVRTYPS